MNDLLQVHRAWRLQRVGEQLFVSGGIDATYLLDELQGDALARFLQAWDTDTLSRWPDLPRHGALIDKLVTLGALFRPVDARTSPPVVGLRWAGAACPPFAQALQAAASSGDAPAWRLSDGAVADITLVVRTDAPMLATSQQSTDIDGPHLLVDLAHHETVVVGPFVVPGQTACLGCLAGRMSHLWGDPPPAPEPAMLSRSVLMASLVAVHLDTFARCGSMPALVQHAWSLSLASWESHLHPVFLLPWCPLCQADAVGPAGIISF